MSTSVYLMAVSDLQDGVLFTVTAWEYSQECVAAAIKIFNDQLDVLKPLTNYYYGSPIVQKLIDVDDGVAAIQLPYDIDKIIDAVLEGRIVQFRQPYTDPDDHQDKVHWYGVDVWRTEIR